MSSWKCIVGTKRKFCSNLSLSNWWTKTKLFELVTVTSTNPRLSGNMLLNITHAENCDILHLMFFSAEKLHLLLFRECIIVIASSNETAYWNYVIKLFGIKYSKSLIIGVGGNRDHWVVYAGGDPKLVGKHLYKGWFMKQHDSYQPTYLFFHVDEKHDLPPAQFSAGINYEKHEQQQNILFYMLMKQHDSYQLTYVALATWHTLSSFIFSYLH